MNKILKKRMLIISISLAFLLLINICVSYSYYLGKVVGNESNTTIGIKSSGIIITYENNSDVIDASNVVPGWSATKNFSISSTVAKNQLNETTSNLWYEIYLYVDKNDFPDNILTYSFSSAGNNVGNGQVAESRTNIGLPLSTELNVITIGTGNVAVGENVHNYSITFDYSIEKSNHPDCIFNARVGAKAVVNSVIYLNIDGGEIEGDTTKYVSKGGTITLQTPIKENAVFDKWIVTKGDARINGNELTVNDAIVEIQAVWITHTIANSILTVDLDGGTWSGGDTLIQTETNSIIKLERPTKPYYIFGGWEKVEGNADISGDNIVVYDSKVLIKAIFIDMVPVFTYKKSDGTDASYIIVRDDATSWRIKFLESGTLNFQSLGNIENNQIDAFLVGGGGGGGTGVSWLEVQASTYHGGGGGGGGGGYTNTSTVSVSYNVDYPVVIGAGGAASSKGQTTTAFSCSAEGGNPGGSGIASSHCPTGCGGGGGSGGNAGGNGGGNGSAGRSGALATKEFGEDTGTLYSGGGGGGGGVSWMNALGSGAGGAGGGGAGNNKGTANTGGGGGGGTAPVSSGGGRSGAAGGSGIIVIRNHK